MNLKPFTLNSADTTRTLANRTIVYNYKDSIHVIQFGEHPEEARYRQMIFHLILVVELVEQGAKGVSLYELVVE